MGVNLLVVKQASKQTLDGLSGGKAEALVVDDKKLRHEQRMSRMSKVPSIRLNTSKNGSSFADFMGVTEGNEGEDDSDDSSFKMQENPMATVGVHTGSSDRLQEFGSKYGEMSTDNGLRQPRGTYMKKESSGEEGGDKDNDVIKTISEIKGILCEYPMDFLCEDFTKLKTNMSLTADIFK